METPLSSSEGTQPRFAHLSTPDPAWITVEKQQKAVDEYAKKLYDLPIDKFREIPYKPAELPSNTPVPGRDILIREAHVTVRDGTQILIRIYQPINVSSGHLFFFNTHGGGIISPMHVRLCRANGLRTRLDGW